MICFLATINYLYISILHILLVLHGLLFSFCFVVLFSKHSTVLGGGAIAGTVFAARAAGEQQLFL